MSTPPAALTPDKFPNIFIATLAQSLPLGGSQTEVYLSSITTLDGQDMSTSDFSFLGRGVLTVDVQSASRIEFISFTGVDAASKKVTGAVRGLSWKDDTVIAANKKFHAVGAPVVIAFGTHNLRDLETVMNTYYNTLVTYIQGVVVGAGVPATELVPGISFVASASDIQNGTDTAVYAGTGLTYSKFVLPSQLKGVSDSITPYMTYGETITTGQFIYVSDTDGKVYKTDSTTLSEALFNSIGIALEDGVADDVKKVQLSGLNTDQSFGNEQTVVTETVDQSQTTTSQTIGNLFNNTFGANDRSFAHFFVSGETVGNITAIDVYFQALTGTGGGDVTLELYEVNRSNMNMSNSAANFGTLLGSVLISSASISASAYNKFTFASPITINPQTVYMFTLTMSAGDSTNYYQLGAGTTVTSYANGTSWAQNSGTSYASVDVGLSGDQVKSVAFKTYYTVQQNYKLGDYTFLTDTAGAISPIPGTYRKVVGSIYADDSVIMNTSELIVHDSIISSSYGNGYVNALQNTYIPKNTRRIIVKTNWSNSSSGENFANQIELLPNSMTSYAGPVKSTFTTSYSFSWSGNILSLPAISGAANDTISVAVYYFR